MALLYASDELIAPKTATETATFTLSKSDVPARLSASGLAGAEAVTIRTQEGPTGSVEVAPYKDGSAITLVATNPVVLLLAPGPYEVTKPVTAGSSGVYLARG